MNNRFKFNAVVSSYYDIDTPEEYREVEPQFYLKNVDVFCTGEIGVDYDTLLDAVKEQSKDLTEKEIGQIMQHFEDNSNSPDCDFVTITPDKIIQCTGLKDKNGKLIYEGDIVEAKHKPDREGWYCVWRGVVQYDNQNCQYVLKASHYSVLNETKLNKATFENNESFNWFDWLEVIGNKYENKDLLEDCE